MSTTTPAPTLGPPVTWYHMLTAFFGLHVLGLTTKQIRVIRRLDTAHTDDAHLEALEGRERTTATGQAHQHLTRTSDRARRRPLARLRKRRLRGMTLVKRLLESVARDDARNVVGQFYELEALGSQARATGAPRHRPLTGAWRVALPLLFPLEVLFSAVLYARVADLELIELAVWSLPAAIAWGIMGLLAVVTALAVHLAGRRLADPRPVDRRGYHRPWLIHVLAPGLVLTAVSIFYGTGAYLRMSGLVAGRGARLGELASILPPAYAVLLGLAPILVAWSVARAHTPEQDELRLAQRAEREGRRTENKLLHKIDRAMAATLRAEADLRGRNQKAVESAQRMIATVEVAIEVNRSYRNNRLHSTAQPATDIVLSRTNNPWRDILDELHADAEGRGWVRQLPDLKAALVKRRVCVRKSA